MEKQCLQLFSARTGIMSWSNSVEMEPVTHDLCALGQNSKTVSPTFSAIFNQISFILLGKQEMHKLLTEFEFQQNRTAGIAVTCP